MLIPPHAVQRGADPPAGGPHLAPAGCGEAGAAGGSAPFLGAAAGPFPFFHSALVASRAEAVGGDQRMGHPQNTPDPSPGERGRERGCRRSPSPWPAGCSL